MNNKEIKSVNWFFGECGDEYQTYTVGSQDVKNILYHEPKTGDFKHFVDIYFENGDVIRNFNINQITYKIN